MIKAEWSENLRFFSLFMEINKAYMSKCYGQMTHLGLHPGQIPFLMLLSEKGEMSQKDIAGELHVKPPTVNVMVQRMEKAGFVSRAWLPDWINYRRSRPLVPNEDTAALDDVVMQVILAEGSATIQELRRLLGFARGRKRRTAPAPGSEEYPEEEKIALDPILTRLQMEARLVIADFEYAVDRRGNPYGWGMARYAAPETLYGPLSAEGTPAESFERLRDHFRRMFPEEPESRLRKLLG